MLLNNTHSPNLDLMGLNSYPQNFPHKKTPARGVLFIGRRLLNCKSAVHDLSFAVAQDRVRVTRSCHDIAFARRTLTPRVCARIHSVIPIKKHPQGGVLFIGRRLRIRTADPLGVNEML